MAEGRAFEWLCAELERITQLDRLESRGTVRLALREAGFSPRSVAPDQLSVVVRRLLPKELEARAVQEPAALCEQLASGLADPGLAEAADSPSAPEEVYPSIDRFRDRVE
jgi:hypothetical protein